MEHCECNVRVPAFYESVDFAVLEVDNTFTRVAKGKKSVWRRCWDWSKSCYGFNEGVELRLLHPTTPCFSVEDGIGTETCGIL